MSEFSPICLPDEPSGRLSAAICNIIGGKRPNHGIRMLNASLKKSGSQTHVTLKGSIDETASRVLMGLLPKLVEADIIFDCAEVATINSVGFRNWIQFLKSLKERSTFNFVRCSHVYTEYAGLLAKTGYAEFISSVLVPFKCEGCGKEDQTEFDVDDLDANVEFDDVICQKCNGLMHAQTTPDDLLSWRA